MARGRTTSKGQGTSGRVRSPESSFSVWEPAGDDYPLDGIAPDDLPVRDISEGEDAWLSSDEAGTEDLGEPRQRPPGARVGEADGFEVAGALSQFAAPPPAADEREPTSDVSSPVRHVAKVVAEPTAQSVLPGLESDARRGQDPAPKRSRRPRSASCKHALRAAQIELWPQTDIASSEK